MLVQISGRPLHFINSFVIQSQQGYTCTQIASWTLQFGMKTSTPSRWKLWSMCSRGNVKHEKSGKMREKWKCAPGHTYAADPSPCGPKKYVRLHRRLQRRLHWSILLLTVTIYGHFQWQILLLKVISGSHAAVQYDDLEDCLQSRRSLEIVERSAALAYEVCSCHTSLRDDRDMADCSTWGSTGFMHTDFMHTDQFELRMVM